MPIEVISTLVPKNNATFPIVDSNDIGGSIQQVDLISDRDAIPSEKRKEGMLVYVKDRSAFYSLVSGITNSNWQNITDNIANLTANNLITNLNGAAISNNNILSQAGAYLKVAPGSTPNKMAVDEDGYTIYIAREGNYDVVAYNYVTAAVQQIKLPHLFSPIALCTGSYTEDGYTMKYLFVAADSLAGNRYSGSIAKIDITSSILYNSTYNQIIAFYDLKEKQENTVDSSSLSKYYSLAYDSTTQTLFTAGRDSASNTGIKIINAKTLTSAGTTSASSFETYSVTTSGADLYANMKFGSDGYAKKYTIAGTNGAVTLTETQSINLTGIFGGAAENRSKLIIKDGYVFGVFSDLTTNQNLYRLLASNFATNATYDLASSDFMIGTEYGIAYWNSPDYIVITGGNHNNPGYPAGGIYMMHAPKTTMNVMDFYSTYYNKDGRSDVVCPSNDPLNYAWHTNTHNYFDHLLGTPSSGDFPAAVIGLSSTLKWEDKNSINPIVSNKVTTDFSGDGYYVIYEVPYSDVQNSGNSPSVLLDRILIRLKSNPASPNHTVIINVGTSLASNNLLTGITFNQTDSANTVYGFLTSQLGANVTSSALYNLALSPGVKIYAHVNSTAASTAQIDFHVYTYSLPNTDIEAISY